MLKNLKNNKFILMILAPIIQYKPFFVISFILQVIPNIPLYTYPLKFHNLISLVPEIGITFFYLVLVSYFLCLIPILLSKVCGKGVSIYFIIIHIFLYIISFIETCCIFLFQTHYESFLWQLVLETNTQETKDFFSTYIFTNKFYIICAIYLLVIVFEFLLTKMLKKEVFRKIYVYVVAISLFVVFLSSAYFVIKNGKVLVNKSSKVETKIKINKSVMIIRFINSYTKFVNLKKEISLSVIPQKNVQIDSCSYKSKNIILIIGESYNKYHSSLYGYSKETNPLLKHREYILFNDVITPINSTSSAFKYFLSFKSSGEDSYSWYETPFFFSIFKKANYNVVFYSNQLVKNDYEANWDFVSGNFIDDIEIEKACFSYRNSQKYQYDEDLLEQYKKERSNIEKDSLNLIVFHLYGQHVAYENRYPKEFTYFTIDSIKSNGLTDKQKQDIAHYDNAVRYNDFVVNEIINMFNDKNAIIIYFADHADEIHDFREFVGRAHDLYKMDKRILRNQLDIPFIIFPTEKYIKTHLSIMDQINSSVDRPFMIDDLPHLLLDLAGIESKWYNSKKSLINPKFNINRKRLVGLNEDIDYDFICN